MRKDAFLIAILSLGGGDRAIRAPMENNGAEGASNVSRADAHDPHCEIVDLNHSLRQDSRDSEWAGAGIRAAIGRCGGRRHATP